MEPMAEQTLKATINKEFTFANSIAVNTTSGLVRGQSIRVLNRDVNEFLGIPFAEPPIGELRFAKPEPIGKPIEGVIDATKTKYSCIQPLFPIYGNESAELTISEDCLTLNIWTTNESNDSSVNGKAVMVWFYGGGYLIGSIFQLPEYNGSVLATYDVVIVTVNYRVGPFGWLYGAEESAPGNVGLYDQQLALHWIKQNIHSFGGDPNLITIFGVSAGSWSVSAHIVSPLSRGLFNRAIMESGVQMFSKNRQMVTKSEALNESKQMAKYFNCSEDQWIECLRRVDAKEFSGYRSQSKNIYSTNAIYGTDILPLSAQMAFERQEFNRDIEVIAGATELEGSALAYYAFPILQTNNITENVFIDLVKQTNETFHDLNVKNITEYYLNSVNKSDSNSVRNAFFEYYGDVFITCPTYFFAKRFAQMFNSDKVFLYEWTYGSSYGAIDEIMGVTHGADFRYVFGLPLMKSSNKVDIEFSLEAMKFWTEFAKKGKPSSGTIWPPIMTTKDNVIKAKDMNALNFTHIIDNPFKSCEEFWINYFL